MKRGKTPNPKESKSIPPKDGRKALDNDFVSVARRLGADEDKARFEAKLGKIAKAKRVK